MDRSLPAPAPTDTIQFLVSIDVEPDERMLDLAVPDPWAGTRRLLADIAAIRDSLARPGGPAVNFTWHLRLDPQIEQAFGDAAWPLKTFAAAFADLARAGDAFGIYPHAWRWDDRRRAWFTDGGDPAWVEQCVRLSLDTFERYFGEPCRILRFGDGWIDEATLDLAERLGVLYDLTVEPGHGPVAHLPHWEHNRGSWPDLRDATQLPHWHPVAAAGRGGAGAAGNHGLWMVPVSTATLGFGRQAASPARPPRGTDLRSILTGASSSLMSVGPLRRLMDRSHRARDAYRRFGKLCYGAISWAPRVETVTLNMVYPPERYARVFAAALASGGGRFVHTVLRSGDLARGDLLANAVNNVAFLAGHAAAARFQIATPETFSQAWPR